MKYIIFITMSIALFFQGCIEYKEDPLCSDYEYITYDELRKSVKVEAPREIKNSGKIYIFNDLLLVNEPNIGIHIIDNKDKENPIPKAFIKLNGNIDVAVKNGYLYADSFIDLVVFDIRDINNIKEIKRAKNVFSSDTSAFYDSYFLQDECNYDMSNGVVIGAKE